MPLRTFVVALAWTLLAALGLGLVTAHETARERDAVQATELTRAVNAASGRAAMASQVALATADNELGSSIADAVLANEPTLAGITIEYANGSAVSRGETGSDLISHRTPVVGPTMEADLLLFGDAAHRPDATRDLGTVTVYAFRPEPTPAVLGASQWRIAAVLVIVLLGYLAMTLWMRRRLARLAQVANALAAGHLEDVPSVAGRDEIAWASKSLAHLRTVLAEQMESVRGRNADLLRDATMASDRLDRIQAFASRLVAPLAEESALSEATEALATQTDASFALLFGVAPAGSLSCEAVFGLSTRLEDPRLLRGLEASGIETSLPGPRPVATLSPEHPWMEVEARHVPHEGVIAIPLRLRGALQGIVVLARRAPFSEADENFLADSAGPFAIALANRSAYEAVVAMQRVLEGKNDELLRQHDQLEVVDRMRAQFVANMSHELRTPINAIIGYTELIEDGCFGPTTPEQREPLRNVLEASASLLTLVNQVLDLSQAEADQGRLELEWCDALEIAQEIARMNAPACRDRPYDIRVRGDAIALETDPQRLKQVLHNLVGNAVKFTERGSVTISVLPLAQGGAQIVVEDTGIGIPPSHLELIFEEFRQVDGSSTRSYDGVGLGLAISRRFVSALGGDLEVSSIPGEGSRFTVSLPARAGNSVSEPSSHSVQRAS